MDAYNRKGKWICLFYYHNVVIQPTYANAIKASIPEKASHECHGRDKLINKEFSLKPEQLPNYII